MSGTPGDRTIDGVPRAAPPNARFVRGGAIRSAVTDIDDCALCVVRVVFAQVRVGEREHGWDLWLTRATHVNRESHFGYERTPLQRIAPFVG